MPDVTLTAALLAGLVSFLSPCVLPLVPPYLVYLTGATLDDLSDSEADPSLVRRSVLLALVFVAGFSTVFVMMGASASLIGAYIRMYSVTLSMVAGGRHHRHGPAFPRAFPHPAALPAGQDRHGPAQGPGRRAPM